MHDQSANTAHAPCNSGCTSTGWREGALSLISHIKRLQGITKRLGESGGPVFIQPPHPIILLGRGELAVRVCFQPQQPKPVILSARIWRADSALPKSPGPPLGLLSQPEPWWPLVRASPAAPLTPCSTDPLLPSAPWCGSLAETEKKKKKKDGHLES